MVFYYLMCFGNGFVSVKLHTSPIYLVFRRRKDLIPSSIFNRMRERDFRSENNDNHYKIRNENGLQIISTNSNSQFGGNSHEGFMPSSEFNQNLYNSLIQNEIRMKWMGFKGNFALLPSLGMRNNLQQCSMLVKFCLGFLVPICKWPTFTDFYATFELLTWTTVFCLFFFCLFTLWCAIEWIWINVIYFMCRD